MVVGKDENGKWQINKQLTVAVLVTIGVIVFSAVFNYATTQAKIEQNCSWIEENKQIVQEVPLLKQKVDTIADDVKEIKDDLKQLIRNRRISAGN